MAFRDDHAVHIWLADPERLDREEVQAHFHGLLCLDEQERAERFRFERDRQTFIVSKALLRQVLSRYHPARPSDWRFALNAFGKPRIATPSAGQVLRFNLTHTQGLVAIAVTSGREVGIDAEWVDRELAWRTLAPSVFADREVAHLESVTESEQRAAFFRYWTLKESYVKARGKGLSIPLKDFRFVLAPGEMPRIEFVIPKADQPDRWWFFLSDSFPSHQLAVAVEGCQDVVPTFFSGSELL
jgi:4'-phosphopantetheinyl transferase